MSKHPMTPIIITLTVSFIVSPQATTVCPTLPTFYLEIILGLQKSYPIRRLMLVKHDLIWYRIYLGFTTNVQFMVQYPIQKWYISHFSVIGRIMFSFILSPLSTRMSCSNPWVLLLYMIKGTLQLLNIWLKVWTLW